MVARYALGERWLATGRSTAPGNHVLISSTLEGRAGLAASVNIGHSGSAAVTASAGLSGRIIRRVGSLSSILEGFATLQASVAAIYDARTVFTGRAGMLANIYRYRRIASDLFGVCQLFANPRRNTIGSANLPVVSNLIASAIRYRSIFVSTGLVGAASIIASLVRGKAVSGQLSASANMTANPVVSTSGAVAGRIIFVPEKIRTIVTVEKIRLILFTGDDEEFNVEERVKQPREVVDYVLDMREWFSQLPDDQIASITISTVNNDDPDTVVSGDLESGPGALPTWEPVGAPPRQARVWLGGGRDGVTYKVTSIVTTTQGRVEEVDFLVIVEDQ